MVFNLITQNLAITHLSLTENLSQQLVKRWRGGGTIDILPVTIITINKQYTRSLLFAFHFHTHTNMV